MKKAKSYLQRHCVVNQGDIVFIGLKELMEYTKLVQLESVLDFVKDNHDDSVGVINELNYQINAILNNEEVENKQKNPSPFDE